MKAAAIIIATSATAAAQLYSVSGPGGPSTISVAPIMNWAQWVQTGSRTGYGSIQGPPGTTAALQVTPQGVSPVIIPRPEAPQPVEAPAMIEAPMIIAQPEAPRPQPHPEQPAMPPAYYAWTERNFGLKRGDLIKPILRTRLIEIWVSGRLKDISENVANDVAVPSQKR